LRHCKHLKRVLVAPKWASAESIRRLKAAIPGCTVEEAERWQ
jgi:hypothetical protein